MALALVSPGAYCASAAPVPGNQGYGTAVVGGAANADDAWAKLLGIATLRLNAQQIGPSSLAGFSQSDQFVQASAAAKEFQSRFPADPRVGLARKFEVQFELQAVQLGAHGLASAAGDLAAAYRSDKSVPVADRFDVALAVESFRHAGLTPHTALVDDGPGYEKLADALHAEFGDLPRVYNLYVEIMRTADPTTASAVADTILAIPTAPSWARAEANSALARGALVGQPMSLTVTTTAGDTVDLGRAYGRPTVVCFWSGISGGSDLSSLSAVKPSIPGGARWIYVALGGESAPTQAVRAKAPFGGVFCHEARQFGGPIAAAFHLEQTPYAFVIGKDGKVLGFGDLNRIPALLGQAGL